MTGPPQAVSARGLVVWWRCPNGHEWRAIAGLGSIANTQRALLEHPKLQNRTLEGHWWRPGHEDQKVAGIVTFEDSNLTLRLLGAFMRPAPRGGISMRAIDRIPMLYGSCEGKLVTLLEARTSNFNIRFAADTGARHTLRARMMLVGVWLDEPDEQCFESLSVGVNNLLEWAARSGRQDEIEQREQGGVRFSTSWSSTDSLTAQFEDAEVTLGLSGSTGHQTHVDRIESIIAERAWFGVTPAEPVSAWQAIERWAGVLQDLVSFAMDSPCALGDLTLHYERPAPPAPAPGEAAEPAEAAEPVDMRRVDVQIYFEAFFHSAPEAKPVDGYDALFRAVDAPFETLLPAWFEARERFGAVIDMMLGLRYVERTHVENRVITSVAAAEGLHRRLLPDVTYAPAEDFTALKASVMAAIPEQHQDWLRSRILNEPSLKQRLEQLLAHLPANVTVPFLPTENRWARRATDTRNWLAHRFEMQNPPDAWEMYVLHRLTSSVLTLLVMQELGLDEAHLRRVASEQKSFQWLATEGPRLAPRVYEAPGATGPAGNA